MQKAMSTYVYVKERLHPGLLDGLVRGGADAVEIFHAEPDWVHARMAIGAVGIRPMLFHALAEAAG
jgi:hypothetical protein